MYTTNVKNIILNILNGIFCNNNHTMKGHSIKAVYTDQLPGDISTLENEASVNEIREAIETLRKEVGR